jgi:hypothetical protein
MVAVIPVTLALVKPGALVFGDLEDGHRNGEHVWRQFVGDLKRYRRALGADALPAIRLHDYADICLIPSA